MNHYPGNHHHLHRRKHTHRSLLWLVHPLPLAAHVQCNLSCIATQWKIYRRMRKRKRYLRPAYSSRTKTSKTFVISRILFIIHPSQSRIPRSSQPVPPKRDTPRRNPAVILSAVEESRSSPIHPYRPNLSPNTAAVAVARPPLRTSASSPLRPLRTVLRLLLPLPVLVKGVKKIIIANTLIPIPLTLQTNLTYLSIPTCYTGTIEIKTSPAIAPGFYH